MAKRRRVPPPSSRAIGRTRVQAPSSPGGVGPRRPITLLLGAIAITAVIVVGIALAGVLGGRPSPSPTASPGPTRTLDPATSLIPAPVLPTADPSGRYPAISGVTCDSLEQTGYHIHAHLTIRIGGEFRSVPANLGIRDSCLYWLHTHRDSGIIHVEAPAEDVYTLGQFFDVWGQALSDQQVLDRVLEPSERRYAYVDGKAFEGDPRTIVLTDLISIEIQVGAAPLEPLPFEFPPDFL